MNASQVTPPDNSRAHHPDGAGPGTETPLVVALGGLAALAAAMGIGRFVYTPILPVMVEELGLTQAEAGLIASANFAGYLAGALLAALPGLPGSRRSWLVGAMVASALTTATMGVVSTMPAFLLLRAAGGLASAFVLVFASAHVLERISEAGRPGLLAVHFAGVGVGIAISAITVAMLVAGGAGWDVLWLASGGVSLGAAFLIARLVPARPDRASAAPVGPGKGDAGLAPLVISYGLFGFGYIITATFIVEIVRSSPAIAPLEPAIWLVVGIAAAPSVYFWNLAAARIGSIRAFALACLVEAAGVAASVLWISPAVIVLAAAILGGTFMGITALGLAVGRSMARGDPRRTLAFMTAAFGLGQIVGPVFAGAVSDATGSFLFPSLAAAGALVVAALLTGRTHVDQTSTEPERS